MERRGRIDVDISGKLQEMSLPNMKRQFSVLFGEMTLVNRAHTVMLYERGVHSRETAAEILKTIDRVEEELTPDDLSLQSGEDLYMNVEHQMIARMGAGAGKMHTGRSRNDLFSCLQRMVCRRELLKVMRSASELEELLLDFAAKNVDTVMTGYTHLQPAQPTTAAHFVTSYLEMLQRDMKRLRAAYGSANLNALGGAAFAGTGFPIDRERTAELLGFDGLVENTWDSVASKDFFMEAEAAYGIMQSSFCRFATDLYTWCTDEFGFWEFGGQVSGQSSIMPQKKNPTVLENIRSLAGDGASAFGLSALTVKNTPLSFILDGHRMSDDFIDATNSVLASLEYMKEALRYSSVHKERALRMAERNFCTVTALADHLVSEYGIPFREAHHITGGMVGDAKEAGLDVTGMDAALLGKWAEIILGHGLPATDEEVRAALLPVSNVESKKCAGGPSPERVRDMIAHLSAQAAADAAWTEEAAGKIDKAYAGLRAAADEIIGK
ncbi:MAG: argininosuccinate lyase [Firmicutes bacterium]|nr:argininosuccinate lyase [Bacillota bacterium]